MCDVRYLSLNFNHMELLKVYQSLNFSFILQDFVFFVLESIKADLIITQF